MEAYMDKIRKKENRNVLATVGLTKAVIWDMVE